ncbi:hypothetical protein PUNSTDRAFT_44576 [Punctularia strigosozonata HHB-11173 SS5]|uniref:uncharacterized protein n=1 Tax=Punctularia strigosozonata (strain HHB-11173) TaxID=741275 RepID=UPI000441664B|nr:uncharacterized protein PUNSTDRAFT_44576 [Punctularia strigosozonata HHB-11173 SS5]EIN09139.1 hypothetical protein PUNSTDRAFT_44576 [Punctularia strigosozonata HHB-11173 SS5]
MSNVRRSMIAAFGFSSPLAKVNRASLTTSASLECSEMPMSDSWHAFLNKKTGSQRDSKAQLLDSVLAACQADAAIFARKNTANRSSVHIVDSSSIKSLAASIEQGSLATSFLDSSSSISSLASAMTCPGTPMLAASEFSSLTASASLEVSEMPMSDSWHAWLNKTAAARSATCPGAPGLATSEMPTSSSMGDCASLTPSSSLQVSEMRMSDSWCAFLSAKTSYKRQSQASLVGLGIRSSIASSASLEVSEMAMSDFWHAWLTKKSKKIAPVYTATCPATPKLAASGFPGSPSSSSMEVSEVSMSDTWYAFFGKKTGYTRPSQAPLAGLGIRSLISIVDSTSTSSEESFAASSDASSILSQEDASIFEESPSTAEDSPATSFEESPLCHSASGSSISWTPATSPVILPEAVPTNLAASFGPRSERGLRRVGHIRHAKEYAERKDRGAVRTGGYARGLLNKLFSARTVRC